MHYDYAAGFLFQCFFQYMTAVESCRVQSSAAEFLFGYQEIGPVQKQYPAFFVVEVSCKTNRLIHKEMISSGGMDSTVIDNRVIARKALDRKASGIILVHNHPSGNAMPSIADINQTRLLNNALKTCDISLLDHVIIAPGSYYSFADEQLVEL